MSGISSFAKFLAKHSDEVFSVAGALTTMLDGLALRPKDTVKVREIIAKLETASGSLSKAADKEAKAPVVKISIADIDAAVAKTLDPLVKAALATHERRIRALEAALEATKGDSK